MFSSSGKVSIFSLVLGSGYNFFHTFLLFDRNKSGGIIIIIISYLSKLFFLILFSQVHHCGLLWHFMFHIEFNLQINPHFGQVSFLCFFPLYILVIVII